MRVIIVGGGTAGWITAGYLNAVHNRLKPTIEITLVESPTVGRIGVGEATFPTLRRTLATFGIAENEFLKRTGSTFKHGVRFEDWAEIGHHYHHPFEALQPGPTNTNAEDWITRRVLGEARPFAYDYGIQATIADAGLSPRVAADPDYHGVLNYAYHVDADEMGDYLAERMTEAGVTHVRANVVSVDRDGTSGLLTAIHLDDGRRLEADFFVDCTGFASVLMGRTLGVGFESYADHLLNDRAVAMRRSYGPDVKIDPFTTAKALHSGWMWRVGLQQRSGQGYVYSSAFLDDEMAEREFRETIGAGEDEQSRLLKFRVGRAASHWVGNCAAIGLSGGFIEPLESTGIYLIEEGAAQLARLLPVDGPNPSGVESYNRHMADLYEEIRDFIVMHYCVTKRTDSQYWRTVVQPEHWPERVRHLLNLWGHRAPAPQDLHTRSAFHAESYQYVLFGMDWVGEPARRRATRIGVLPPSPPASFDAKRGEALRLLPSHGDYLAAVLAS